MQHLILKVTKKLIIIKMFVFSLFKIATLNMYWPQSRKMAAKVFFTVKVKTILKKGTIYLIDKFCK